MKKEKFSLWLDINRRFPPLFNCVAFPSAVVHLDFLESTLAMKDGKKSEKFNFGNVFFEAIISSKNFTN
jgi:hypothetical protein